MATRGSADLDAGLGAPPALSCKCAVITMSRDEALLFPVFLRYYAKHFAAHEIIVLDHLSQDGSLSAGFALNVLPTSLPEPDELGGRPFVRVDLRTALATDPLGFNPHFCPELWRPRVLADAAARLLEGPGEVGAVVCVDIDEIVCLDPLLSKGDSTLREVLASFALGKDVPAAQQVAYATCRGFEVHHDVEGGEPVLDFSKDVLSQRRLMFANTMYNKPAVLRGRVSYSAGQHYVQGPAKKPRRQTDVPQLLLLHLHRADFQQALARHGKYWEAEQAGRWDPKQPRSWDFHYRFVDPRSTVDAASGATDFVEKFWGRLEGPAECPRKAKSTLEHVKQPRPPTWVVRPWKPGSGCEKQCSEPKWIPDEWRSRIHI